MFRSILITAVTVAALPAAAQNASLDASQMRSAEDVNVTDGAGEKLGEIEEILIGADGKPAAYVLDMGGFLDIGDEDVLVAIDALGWQNGSYVTEMTEDELKNLPRWDD